MKAKASVRVKLSSERYADSILEAIKPETERPATVRAKERLRKEGHYLVLDVEAEDTVALRAALNAYLRWIGSAKSVLELLEVEKSSQ